LRVLPTLYPFHHPIAQHNLQIVQLPFFSPKVSAVLLPANNSKEEQALLPMDPIVPKKYGTTDPISVIGPSTKDAQISRQLEDYLLKANLFESIEESARREDVLGKLNNLIGQWVHQVSIRKGLTENLALDAGAKLFTFGSYRLGVNAPGGDIDTLLVCPVHIDREEFFQEVPEILKASSEVADLTVRSSAFIFVSAFFLTTCLLSYHSQYQMPMCQSSKWSLAEYRYVFEKLQPTITCLTLCAD
jgi:hypothetical protein